MKSCLLIWSIAAVLSFTFAVPAPNDLKAKFIEDNEIPGKKVLSKSVGAEFGGYRVSAGLGGGENGGAIFANAEAPGANANAGLYSSGAATSSASAASSSGYGASASQGQGFFDRIFNIPISVLQSVNSYVKTKGKNGETVYTQVGHSSAGASAGSGLGASASVGGPEGGLGTRIGTDLKSSYNDESLYSSSAAAVASAGDGHQKHGKPDYDRIFNIPITALKSVNDFLNG